MVIYKTPDGFSNMIMNSDGETLTYNDISKRIAKNRGIEKMSSQAVGGANNVDIYNFFGSLDD